MARVVTVHLVIADEDEVERKRGVTYHDANVIADGLSAFLGDGEASGFLLDWGYANGGMPEQAHYVEEAGYEEGDFYAQVGLEHPTRERQR